jgi:hypothetical protein
MKKLYKFIRAKPSLYDLVYLIESKILFKLCLFNKQTNLEPILSKPSPNLLANDSFHLRSKLSVSLLETWIFYFFFVCVQHKTNWSRG